MQQQDESIQVKWDASLYDDKHNFVFTYGEELIDLLKPVKGERILDLGCGTGYLSNCISGAGAKVTGIDSSAEMIRQAKANYPGIEFSAVSALEFVAGEPFDAIFSNAVLHWIKEKDRVIDTMFRNCSENGRLVLEMGGKQNVAGIIQALRMALSKYGFTGQAGLEQWYFPSLSEYTGLLEQRGFRVNYAAYFSRETLLKNTDHGIKDWIEMFGTAYLQGIDAASKEKVLAETEDILRPTHFREGKWYADYKRLRVLAVKPGS